MKKNYISPEILVLNANIMSELLSQSGRGNGNGKYDFGGGKDGDKDPGGSTVLPGGDDEFEGGLGSKGDSWSSWDD